MGKKKRIRKIPDFKVDDILLKDRQLFLFGEINEELSRKLVKQILAVDRSSKKPKQIVLWINSPGGSVSDGLAIIDTMRTAQSPIVTVIVGEACSMAAFISVCGDKRVMTKNSVWMQHPMTAGTNDYFSFMKDRIKGLELYDKITNKILKAKTKLTPKEIEKVKNGELWFTADEAKKKGVCDKVG